MWLSIFGIRNMMLCYYEANVDIWITLKICCANSDRFKSRAWFWKRQRSRPAGRRNTIASLVGLE